MKRTRTFTIPGWVIGAAATGGVGALAAAVVGYPFLNSWKGAVIFAAVYVGRVLGQCLP